MNELYKDWEDDFDQEFDLHEYAAKFNKMPRTLRNGDIALPFTVQYVIKKIDNY